MIAILLAAAATFQPYRLQLAPSRPHHCDSSTLWMAEILLQDGRAHLLQSTPPRWHTLHHPEVFSESYASSYACASARFEVLGEQAIAAAEKFALFSRNVRMSRIAYFEAARELSRAVYSVVKGTSVALCPPCCVFLGGFLGALRSVKRPELAHAFRISQSNEAVMTLIIASLVSLVHAHIHAPLKLPLAVAMVATR